MLIGRKIAYGIPRIIKEISQAPPGRQRLRLRADKPAVLFVKDKTGIRAFQLEDRKYAWVPLFEMGRNIRL
jgi:hypothetical protein